MSDAMERRRSKPLITANQVTFGRLAVLPIGAWLVYQGLTGQWVALVFMTLVGCTDFVDGWLARRHGPTVLGGMMDPIADKMFIALTFLPCLDPRVGWLPVAPTMLLFLREFLITAARTSYERRRVTLKSSYLGKVKTWLQMVAIGIVFLTRVLERQYLIGFFVVCVAAPLVGTLVFYVIKRRLWLGSLIFAGGFGVALPIAWLFPASVLVQVMLWSTVALTWVSGGSYLLGAGELLRQAPLDRHDVVRLIGAVALAVLGVLLVSRNAATTWLLIAVLAIEFAISGLENLLAHEGRLPSFAGTLLRVALQTGAMGAALVLPPRGVAPIVIDLLIAAVALVTLVMGARLFIVERDVYLGKAAQP